MAALSRWVIQVLAAPRERLLDEIDYTFDCLKDSFERNNLFKTILSNTGRLDIPKRDIDTCDPISLLSQERLNPWLDQSPYRQVSTSIIQWGIQGRGPGGPAPPLALVYTEAWRAQKFFLRPPPPSPYLKVWIRHCYFLFVYVRWRFLWKQDRKGIACFPCVLL